MVNLSSKEKFLLEGEKYQQQLAMDKFNDFTLHAKDDNLKTLFSNLSKIEESHLNLIDEMLQGKVPLINNKSIHPYYESNTFNSNNYLSVGGMMLTSLDNNYSYEDGDKIICFDALTTEELLHYTYNISKSEPVLNGASVAYTNHFLIKDTLEYDFNEEKNYDYSNKSIDEIVSHLVVFTSNIWQIHPFAEGNTRTTALFIQKYIQYLGLGKMNNEIFKDNSKYFRNALVRANYRDISINVYEDNSFLYKFFSNLLLKTKYVLNNEELYIDKNKKEKNIESDELDIEL